MKDIVFKCHVAVLVFVLLLGTVELVAWQWCRVLVAPHRQMREPAYLEAYRGLEEVEEHLRNLRAADFTLEYQPYCLWGISEVRTSTYNVLPDWGGIRKTVNVAKPDRERKVRVFLFGGSTVFCSRVPDRYTLASCLSANLSRRFPEVEFSVTNFGRGGYVSDQEVVLLTQVLTAGATPDLVVFYDGANDTINKVCKGVPHYQYDRFRSVETGGKPTVGLLEAASQYEYVGKLAGLMAGRPPEAARYVTDRKQLLANARAMADRYRQNLAFVRRLGRAYGFEAVFFWQPDLFTTAKALTDEEAAILRGDAKAPVWRPGFKIAHQVIAETMPDQAAFCDLSDVLDPMEGTVFFDVCHVSAAANERISDRIAETLAQGGHLSGAKAGNAGGDD
jgi:lysophospholipase L1-like esterase